MRQFFSLLFMILGFIAMFVVVKWASDFYYEPVCKRYGQEHHLKYESYRMRTKSLLYPSTCNYLDRNNKRVEVRFSRIPKTPEDLVRGIVRWLLIMGVAILVAGVLSEIGGVPLGRRRERW